MTLITVGIVLAAAAFVLWLLYTVTWRGVRRGLLEYQRSAAGVPAPQLSTRVLRPAPHEVLLDGIVPDYPPREWV